MSISSKTFKSEYGTSTFYESVDVIKEVFKKKDNKLQYKLSKKILKVKNNHICLISKRIPKGKLCTNLCIKHVRLRIVNEDAVLKDDYERCRTILDPVGNEVLIRFKSIDSAIFLTRLLEKCYKKFIEAYEKISATIYVINEASDILEGKFTVSISGTANGEDLKKIVEERFKMPGLLSMRYSLEIQCGTNIVSVIDEMPIFFLNEYFTGEERPLFCSRNCNNTVTLPTKNITLIVIDQANHQRKNYSLSKQYRRTAEGIDVMYNIDERWQGDLMPTWLMRLMSDVYFYGPAIEGVFRKNVKVTDLRPYYEHMLKKDDFLVAHNMLLKSSVLKMFIIKIEGGLFNMSEKDIDVFIDNIQSQEKFLANKELVSKLLNIIMNIPKKRLVFFQHLLVVFKAISDSTETRMNAYNIGAMLSPTIFNQIKYQSVQNLEKAMRLSILTECMILLVDRIVSPDTRQRIIATFTKYKSDYSPSLSVNYYESCTSTSSITPVVKAVDNHVKYEDIYTSMTEDDCTNDEFDTDCIYAVVNRSGQSLALSTRSSRIRMGTALFDKWNNATTQSQYRENIDPVLFNKTNESINLSPVATSSRDRSLEPLQASNRSSVTSSVLDTVSPPISIPVVVNTNYSKSPIEHQPYSNGTSSSTIRHVSMMGTRVTSLPRQQRKNSNMNYLRPQVTVRNPLRRSNSRLSSVLGNMVQPSATMITKNNSRSRSPYVKSLVERYERRIDEAALQCADVTNQRLPSVKK